MVVEILAFYIGKMVKNRNRRNRALKFADVFFYENRRIFYREMP